MTPGERWAQLGDMHLKKNRMRPACEVFGTGQLEVRGFVSREGGLGQQMRDKPTTGSERPGLKFCILPWAIDSKWLGRDCSVGVN